MSRIRTIKPEFWTSAQVLECSTNARLLFIGLWNFADDHGRHPDSEKQCKAEVFPSDDFTLADVRGLLDELATNGLIEPYVVDGRGYIQITGWYHQRIDKPQSPKYPGPFLEESENDIGSIPPEGKGREGKGEECASRFDEFWEVWPKKKAKPDAQKAWKQMGCDQFADDLIAHVRDRKARDPEWLKDDGKYIPHAGTFLRGKRWEDEWEPAEAKQSEEVIH